MIGKRGGSDPGGVDGHPVEASRDGRFFIGSQEMNPRRSVVLLAPDDARREELWTPQAAALARQLNLEVQLSDGALPPQSIHAADAVITSWGSPQLDQTYLAGAPRLQIVGHAAGSVQSIVSAELFARGIRVVSANAVMAQCVAQWSLMMTLAAARSLLDSANLGQHPALNWRQANRVRGLHQLTIGLWGYGSVAKQFIALLRSLGVRRVLVASEWLTQEQALRQELEKVELAELFARGDILHLMEALTPPRVGLIDAALLGRMRDGATLINSARAHLVDEQALLRQLESGRISACLDVFHTEPLPADHPLRRLPNVILTPHNAGNGNRDQYVPLVLHEFSRHFRGQPLMHEISPAYAQAMTCEYTRIGRTAPTMPPALVAPQLAGLLPLSP
jgi:phosphoglycerate dehydrogenase-like enzyme